MAEAGGENVSRRTCLLMSVKIIVYSWKTVYIIQKNTTKTINPSKYFNIRSYTNYLKMLMGASFKIQHWTSTKICENLGSTRYRSCKRIMKEIRTNLCALRCINNQMFQAQSLLIFE